MCVRVELNSRRHETISEISTHRHYERSRWWVSGWVEGEEGCRCVCEGVCVCRGNNGL